MNKTNLLLGAVGVVALVVAILALSKPAQVIIEKGFGSVVSSQSLESPICVDGTCTYIHKQKIASTWAGGAGTSTPCATRSPLNATTTLERFVWNNSVATGTAAQLSLATTSSAFATTSGAAGTALVRSDLASGRLVVEASNQKTLTFYPRENSNVVGPGQWVVVGAQGSFGHQFEGSCLYEFKDIK